MQACKMDGIFSGKKCACKVSDAEVIEEKGFLSSSQHIVHQITVSGDVVSQAARKDSEFVELFHYLQTKYPNGLIPPVSMSQVLKVYDESYIA